VSIVWRELRSRGRGGKVDRWQNQWRKGFWRSTSCDCKSSLCIVHKFTHRLSQSENRCYNISVSSQRPHCLASEHHSIRSLVHRRQRGPETGKQISTTIRIKNENRVDQPVITSYYWDRTNSLQHYIKQKYNVCIFWIRLDFQGIAAT